MKDLNTYDLFYNLIYYMKQRGIHSFDMYKLEEYLFSAKNTSEYCDLFLLASSDPISKRINLDDEISMFQTIGAVNVKMFSDRLIVKIAPIELKNVECSYKKIISKLVEEYIESTKIDTVDNKILTMKKIKSIQGYELIFIILIKF